MFSGAKSPTVLWNCHQEGKIFAHLRWEIIAPWNYYVMNSSLMVNLYVLLLLFFSGPSNRRRYLSLSSFKKIFQDDGLIWGHALYGSFMFSSSLILSGCSLHFRYLDIFRPIFCEWSGWLLTVCFKSNFTQQLHHKDLIAIMKV